MKSMYAVFFIWCVVWAQITCTQQEDGAELTQAFFHDSGQLSASIELGKIVFYFSKDVELAKPEIIQSTSDGKKRVEFRFNGAHATKEVIKAARKLFKRVDKKICNVDLFVSPGRNPSLVLRLVYNPDNVGFESELFEAIKHEKGFMCTLLNKSLLERLSPETNSILRTVCHEAKHGVVIDMGHGGDDYGARGLFPMMPEKDITLAIGTKLSGLLRCKGFDVFCTRSDDSFVPLDDRTSFSNKCNKADILVSIHANSGGCSACGIETFCYKSLGQKTVSDLLNVDQYAYKNILLLKRYDQSLSLAQLIQSSVFEQAKKKQRTVVNRGVKKAVAQLLAGSSKPAVLIEVGFVTHPIESALLVSSDYQDLIARGIRDGICAYFKRLAAA